MSLRVVDAVALTPIACEYFHVPFQSGFDSNVSNGRDEIDNINTAAYSPHPNMPATMWENQLSEKVKEDDLQWINKMNLQHAT
ncbi:hypothetical protein ACHAWX_000178 [Stephanocyclus meneghinianus]